MSLSDPALITALAAMLGVIVALIKAYRTPVGEQASAAEKYQSIAYKAISDCDEMREELNNLRVQLGEFEIRFSEWEHGVEKLIHQLKAHNLDPVWEPEKEE